jgi:1-acyl-sn-glycerol-3-phosphate acyltransferase
MMESLLCKFAMLVYAIRGWAFEPLPDYWRKKSVIIGFPHRENMDTVMAFAGFKRVRVRGYILIKKSWFFWPLSYFMRGIGGLPVDRSAPGGVVGAMVKEFEQREDFILALVPEGSRKNVSKLRTGFWHIAKAAQVPIICWYLDSKNKKTRWVGYIEAGEDLNSDLWKIHDLYAEAGFEIPMEGIPKD